MKLQHRQFSYDILENQDRTRIPPAAINDAAKPMSLDLSKIQYVVSGTKVVKGKGLFASSHSVPRPPEEIFLLSQMAPASHGHDLTNEYFLNANIKYDGCTCCSPLPSISIPMTVIPLTHEASYGFQEPAGYNPHILGSFRCEIKCL